MADTSSNPSSQTMLTSRWWFPGAIILGLVLLNIVLLFIPGDRLTEDRPVFFWQRYNNYLFQIRCLTLILVPIAVVVIERISVPASGKRETDRRGALTAFALFVFMLSLFINYSSWFILGSVSSIGTVSFNGHVYHLATYAKYDDPTIYYLGECDQSGYWCVFQRMYWTFNIYAGQPKITASDDGQLIMVRMGSDTVYTFNGEEGFCSEGASLVICYEGTP